MEKGLGLVSWKALLNITLNSMAGVPFAANSDCPVCFKPFDEPPVQTVVALACPKKHLIDRDCILRWFRSTPIHNRKCLICLVDAEPMLVVRMSALDLLHDSCLYDYAGTAREILQQHANLANRPVCNPYTGKIDSPFAVAVKSQSREVVFALIDHGLDVHSPIEYGPEEGEYPLHVAAARGDVALVTKLLDKGVDVDCLTSSCPALQSWLLKQFKAADYWPVYDTPIGRAVKYGHCTVVKQLLDAGSLAPPFRGKGREDTLLSLAVEYDQAKVIDFLLLFAQLKRPLSFGLERHSYFNCLLFALFEAAILGHTACVKALLGVCNTQSVRSRFFLYPLWYAIDHGQKEVVEIMLKAGFNNQIHNYGQSLREYAVQCGNQEMVKLIDEYGANYTVSRKDKMLAVLRWLMLGMPDGFATNHCPSRIERFYDMLVWLLLEA